MLMRIYSPRNEEISDIRERILKYQVVLSQHQQQTAQRTRGDPKKMKDERKKAKREDFYLFIHFQAIWELFVTGEQD